MATLTETRLKEQSREEQRTYYLETVAQERAAAISRLLQAEIEDPEHVVDDALGREGLEGYPPTDERLNRARAALDSVVALHTSEFYEHPGPAKERDISLAQIMAQPDVQIRANGTDPDKVEEYADRMREGDRFPPLTCFWDGDTLWLADGFHRYEAALSSALAVTFPCCVHSGDRLAAEEYAATCNAKHGMPMTREDKRRAIRRLLKLHTDWADKRIASAVGASWATVRKLRVEMESGSQIETLETLTGADGKEYPRTVEVQAHTRNVPAEHFAEIWQLENAIRNYMDNTLGRVGGWAGYPNEVKKTSYDKHIDLIRRIKSTYKTDTVLPGDMRTPDNYRKTDMIQAINNVLEQYRQEEREHQKAKATPEPALTDMAREQLGAEIQEPDGTAGDTTPRPPWEENRVDTSDEAMARREKLRKALLYGDHRDLRAYHTANPNTRTGDLETVLFSLSIWHDKRPRAVKVLVSAILEPWGPPMREEVPDTACPHCGGNLIEVRNGTVEPRIICQDCGWVTEPEEVE